MAFQNYHVTSTTFASKSFAYKSCVIYTYKIVIHRLVVFTEKQRGVLKIGFMPISTNIH